MVYQSGDKKNVTKAPENINKGAESKSVADKVREEIAEKKAPEKPAPKKGNPDYVKVEKIQLEKSGKDKYSDVKRLGTMKLLQEHIDTLNNHKHNTLIEYRKI